MANAKSMKYLAVLGLVIVVIFALYYFSGCSSASQGFQNADTFTLYYADWCPHCKTVKPIFQEFAKAGSMVINGKTVFLDMAEADKDAAKAKGKPVKGYPTFLLEKADGSFVEFDGERNAAGWKSWLAKNL